MQQNNISELLDIFIITYNRASKLKKTFEQILSKESPIRNFEINIIDNNSSDDTASVVQNYKSKFPNVKYIKNKYNIGANANIMKAFYMTNKKYVWVLADNDEYCWDSWDEVENAILQNKDAIMVSTYEYPWLDIAQFFIQTTFLPGVIYNTNLINDNTMGNMAFNISNMFPHLALSSKLINENKDVYIVKNAIIEVGNNKDEVTGEYKYTRGYSDKKIHTLMKDMNWVTGFANSLYMIQDKKVRNYIATHNKFYISELTSAKIFFYNEKNFNGNLYNLLSIFCVLNFANKIRFLFNWLCFYTLYKILFIYSECKRVKNRKEYYKQYRICILNLIKIKLFKIKIKEQK